MPHAHLHRHARRTPDSTDAERARRAPISAPRAKRSARWDRVRSPASTAYLAPVGSAPRTTVRSCSTTAAPTRGRRRARLTAPGASVWAGTRCRRAARRCGRAGREADGTQVSRSDSGERSDPLSSLNVGPARRARQRLGGECGRFSTDAALVGIRSTATLRPYDGGTRRPDLYASSGSRSTQPGQVRWHFRTSPRSMGTTRAAQPVSRLPRERGRGSALIQDTKMSIGSSRRGPAHPCPRGNPGTADACPADAVDDQHLPLAPHRSPLRSRRRALG